MFIKDEREYKFIAASAEKRASHIAHCESVASNESRTAETRRLARESAKAMRAHNSRLMGHMREWISRDVRTADAGIDAESRG